MTTTQVVDVYNHTQMDAPINDPVWDKLMNYLGVIFGGIIIAVLAWAGKVMGKRFEKYLDRIEMAGDKIDKVGESIETLNKSIKELTKVDDRLEKRMDNIDRRIKQIEEKIK